MTKTYSSSNVVRTLHPSRPLSATKSVSYSDNNLDQLLKDLKTTVDRTAEHLKSSRDRLDNTKDDNIISLDPHLREPKSRVVKSTYTSKTTPKSNEIAIPVIHEYNTGRPSSYEEKKSFHRNDPNFREHVETKVKHDVTYDSEPEHDTSPKTKTTTTKRSYYSKTNSTRTSPRIVELGTTDLPAKLRDIPISYDLSTKQPGNEVTKTIKTYTYDPNDVKVPSNQNYSYKNEYYNSSNTSRAIYPERDILPPANKTTIYSSDTQNRIENTIPINVQPNESYFYRKEEVNKTTTNNVYGPPPTLPQPINKKSTSFYESNITSNPIYHAPTKPVEQLYTYKEETTNTTNTVYQPEPAPNTYYTAHTVTKHTEREPLLTPAKFPTNDIQPTHVDGTPKHLGQLLASFENENVKVDDEPYVPRKEINTALAEPTKNVAGKPVYYPPGQELFSKSEAQAALRAKGGQAKARGNYDYAAESKSKNASKGGAAVVPLCVPLCCAAPCSIM